MQERSKVKIMASKLITIATYCDPLEAEFSKAKLDAESIEYLVSEDSTRNIYGYAIGKIRIQVKKSDADKALKILKRDE